MSVQRLAAAIADRYRIERELGAGGMATVYLAHDLKHDRDVAIKVLHEDLGATLGPERFLAEIKTTAKLQHPHILPLLDSGDAGGLLFYVMPYVPGETLRERLTRETQLPIEDAVRIAHEVADALGFAHGHGIIHRDIKPENILLQGGHALVADFGIALAVQHAGGARLTQTGLSLGTPQYMAPEQAMGEKTVDHRADIYALGAVTYEMLTGEPPFTGASVQAIVAKVMTERPVALSTVRDTVPVAVENTVLRALAKLPADRFATAAAFVNGLSGIGASDPALHSAGVHRRRDVRWTPFSLAMLAVALIAMAVAGTVWSRTTSTGTSMPVPDARFQLTPPPGHRMAEVSPAISADGRVVVFVADSGGVRRLFARKMNALAVTAVRGTEGIADAPRLSHDGSTVIFQVGERLMRASLAGTEPPVSVPGVPKLMLLGGAASFDLADDRSLYIVAELSEGILRIDAAGRRVDTVRRVERASGEFGVRHPILLPAGNGVIFGVFSRTGWALMARSLDGSREIKLVDGASKARFAAPDLLVFSRASSLFAVRFDVKQWRMRGEPVLVAADLPSEFFAVNQAVFFDLSQAGIIVTLAGARGSGTGTLRLVERETGRMTSLRDSSGARPRFSPDGRSLVAEDSAQQWIYDLSHGGTRTRFTRTGVSYVPVWSRDGSHIIMSTYDGGAAQLWSYALKQPGSGQRLLPSVRRRFASSFTPDGRDMALVELNSETGPDIWIMKDGRTVTPLLHTASAEKHPRFSPNGTLLAFASDETGRDEVYVRSYPTETGRPVRVSTNGGTAPVWHPSGRELFFVRGEEIYATTLTGGSTLTFNEPKLVARIPGFETPDVVSEPYDISPDGRRFVVWLAPLRPVDRSLNVILGFHLSER